MNLSGRVSPTSEKVGSALERLSVATHWSLWTGFHGDPSGRSFAENNSDFEEGENSKQLTTEHVIKLESIKRRFNAFLKTDDFIVLFQSWKLSADVSSLSTVRVLFYSIVSILREQVFICFFRNHRLRTLLRREKERQLRDKYSQLKQKTPRRNPWGEDVNYWAKTVI